MDICLISALAADSLMKSVYQVSSEQSTLHTTCHFLFRRVCRFPSLSPFSLALCPLLNSQRQPFKPSFTGE
jgi:hypothetical protein